jgi:phosphoenolpyruvate-protein kinase (PTS system EI component)
MAFIVETIRGRENAKFAFTHSLSDALKLLKLYGESRGISAEDMACVNIHDILRLATHCISDDFSDCIIKNIAEGKKHSEVARSIHLPHIIIKKEDVQVVEHLESQPNFITQKKIISQTVQLNSDNDVQIENKIVFIESADPGFDWVFSRNIAGLITMFGGANSHMAIRCAEFSIPAAIGCGAVLYETLSSAPTIELDCSGGIIRAGGITCA